MEGKELKIGNFASLEEFASYAEQFYLPLLDRLSEPGAEISENDGRLLAFLHDDLVSFVNCIGN